MIHSIWDLTRRTLSDSFEVNLRTEDHPLGCFMWQLGWTCGHLYVVMLEGDFPQDNRIPAIRGLRMASQATGKMPDVWQMGSVERTVSEGLTAWRFVWKWSYEELEVWALGAVNWKERWGSHSRLFWGESTNPSSQWLPSAPKRWWLQGMVAKAPQQKAKSAVQSSPMPELSWALAAFVLSFLWAKQGPWVLTQQVFIGHILHALLVNGIRVQLCLRWYNIC